MQCILYHRLHVEGRGLQSQRSALSFLPDPPPMNSVRTASRQRGVLECVTLIKWLKDGERGKKNEREGDEDGRA